MEAYLDEALSPEEMAEVERVLRKRPEMLRSLVDINSRRDAGMHSIGAIWRRHHVTCPQREQLGSYLLGVLSEEHARYVKFHIERIGCRVGRANLADLQAQQEEAADAAAKRRTKYFQSSAGYLRRK